MNEMAEKMQLEFAGETLDLDPGRPFVIGREGDLVIDDNPYLHRRFLELRFEHGMWWLANVGAQLTATVSYRDHGVHAWLAPGARMPIVFGVTDARFTAGPTQYEISLILADAPYAFEAEVAMGSGSTTIGRMTFTRDQRSMLVALAESALRRGAPGVSDLPTSAAAARRIGWTLKRFEKKIDNVCEKLAAIGVRGLKGDVGNLASSRRARLVEYVLASRLITSEDLWLLDRPLTASGDDADEE